ERFRKNYLIKIREIEKQIITKQNIEHELKMKINDIGSFVSEIVPNPENGELNRLSLVSFIDRIEIGEDNAIN
ncbi:recombinase, partial [Streptococcus agalactiae]